MRWWSRGDGLSVLAVALGTLGAVFAMTPAIGTVLAVLEARGDQETTEVEVEVLLPEEAFAQALHQLTSVAFRASSFRGYDVIQGDYAGRISHDRSGFRLTVPSARLRYDGGYGYPLIRLRGIRLSLVEEGPHGARVIRAGPTHLVEEELYGGDSIPLEELVLTLDGVSEEDVHWPRQLVIEHVGMTEGSTPLRLRENWAHIEVDALFTLFGWEAGPGC